MPYSATYKLYGPAMIIILFYLLFFISLIVFLRLHRMFRVFVVLQNAEDYQSVSV